MSGVERPQGGGGENTREGVLTEREREKGSRARAPVGRPGGFALTREQKTNKETRKAGGRPKPTSASPLTFASFLIKDADRQRQWLRGAGEQLAGNESLIEKPI